MALHIDFETRSRVNLRVAGVYNYAMDPSTKVLCMGYAMNDEEPELWLPHEQVFPYHIREYIENGEDIYAHNAAFERLIFDFIVCPDFGIYPIKLDQWVCTATMARASGLPGSLADVSRILGGEQKDSKGFDLIRKLSLPLGSTMKHKGFMYEGTEFNNDEALLEEMYEYCIQDVITERDIAKALRPLSAQERAEYVVNEKINDRGLKIDRPVAEAAVSYAAEAKAEADAEIVRLTNGTVKSTGSIKLTTFVHSFLNKDQEGIMVKPDGKLSLDKAIQNELLDVLPDGLPRKLVEAKQGASKSSVAKFQAMLGAADPEDDRVRGAYIMNGAASTGRYSAQMLQPHNFPRACAKDPEAVREQLIRHDKIEGVMGVLSSMLRPSILADEGRVFVGGDWSSIEARVLPWLTRSYYAEERLDVFRSGHDIYVATADKFGGSRQEGKTMELACGFAGGVGAFQTMSRITGVQVTDARAEELKTIWRRDNPWAEPFWNGLVDAAIKAVRNPGEEFSVGRIVYTYIGPKGGGGTLYCRLPSRRYLGYPRTQIDIVDGRYGPQTQLTAIHSGLKPKRGEEWPRKRLWRGLLAENVTQAVAADVLRDCQVRCEEVLTGAQVGDTHDELLLEVDESDRDMARDELQQLMDTPPAWAEGLPLAAELWTGKRYGK